MEDLLKVAIEAARKAGAIHKQRVGQIKSLDYKSAFNIVTDVDKDSEAVIIGILKEHFPDDRILAEESGALPASATRTWIIDPLDGTTNFTHGYPCFAVSIGLEDEGQQILGVVYNAISDELFFAQQGKGAYLNDRKISVSSTDSISASLLATGFQADTKLAKVPNLNEFARLTDMSHGVRRDGSAALDLCSVACGRLDGYWELKLGPWDMSAGTLIVKEAGGRVTNVLGGQLEIMKHNMLATNGKIHDAMLTALDFSRFSSDPSQMSA